MEFKLNSPEREALRKKIFSKVDELPTLPAVLPKLLRLMESEQTDASHVSKTISNDPALTSKILKAANSAYYGFSQEISTLDRAIPLLGFNKVRSLALSIGVLSGLSGKGLKSSSFSQEALWIHSLAVATILQNLAARVGDRADTEHLFVVGLLHDIGEIVLEQFFSESLDRALSELEKQRDLSLDMAERRIIGMDHGEIGSMLLNRWKFPSGISDPIFAHHQEQMPETVNVKDVAMLRVSDTLAKCAGFGYSQNFVIPNTHQKDMALLGIGEKDVSTLKAGLEEAREGIVAFFKALD